MILRPLKAYPPLLVDSDAELVLPVAAQGFKAIAGQPHQVVAAYCSFENVQTSFRLFFERLKLPHPLTSRKTLRALVTVFRRSVWQS